MCPERPRPGLPSAAIAVSPIRSKERHSPRPSLGAESRASQVCSDQSSVGKTSMVVAVSPCFRAFPRDFSLPSGVLGPVCPPGPFVAPFRFGFCAAVLAERMRLSLRLDGTFDLLRSRVARMACLPMGRGRNDPAKP